MAALVVTKSTTIPSFSCMKRVTTHEAKTHLSRLLEEVEAGEEVLVCRGDRPAARLVPVTAEPARERPRVGTRTSPPVVVAEGAFAPLTEEELAVWGLRGCPARS